jgi:hypothetical protein
MWHAWGRGWLPTGFWWGSSKERNHLENLGVDDKLILKWIFKKSNVGMDSICPRRETGSCKCDNEPPDSIEYREFVD